MHAALIRTAAAGFALALGAGAALAQATPVGLWKTIDDETKKEKSLVRIADGGGTLTGTVEKLLDPAKQNSVCDKCSGELKDKPVLGMTIVRGAKKSADGDVWEGGEILDPNNGRNYKLRLKPTDGGKSLEVRGYIGPFHRNQTWLRVE